MSRLRVLLVFLRWAWSVLIGYVWFWDISSKPLDGNMTYLNWLVIMWLGIGPRLTKFLQQERPKRRFLNQIPPRLIPPIWMGYDVVGGTTKHHPEYPLRPVRSFVVLYLYVPRRHIVWRQLYLIMWVGVSQNILIRTARTNRWDSSKCPTSSTDILWSWFLGQQPVNWCQWMVNLCYVHLHRTSTI